MIVTREFILKHQTANGAWTRAQLNALGVSWPPINGWLRALVGTTITQQQADAFIQGATIFAKNQATRTPQALFAE